MLKDNLKGLREANGLTQKQLAKELGISPQRYNYYETGRSEPDQEMLAHIAAYYNISVADLLVDGDYEWIKFELPEETLKFIEKTAKKLGITHSEVLHKAIKAYRENEHLLDQVEETSGNHDDHS